MENLDPAAAFPDAAPAPPSPPKLVLPRPVLLGSLVVMAGFVGLQSPKLWREYMGLRQQWSDEDSSRPVHYKDLMPQPSYADPPANWYHDTEDGARLWAGWDRKARAHSWFRLGYADLNPKTLSAFKGADSARAIDCAIVEEKGGDYWGRIPVAHCMFVGELEASTIVYPQAVLDKVIVVNDATRSHPTVAVIKPLDPGETAVDLYDPVAGGRRFLLRQTGYLIANRPLLFDRDEQNLWVTEEDRLRAISGPSKGLILPRLARMKPSTWGEVQSKYPGAVLLVGADRKREVAKP